MIVGGAVSLAEADDVEILVLVAPLPTDAVVDEEADIVFVSSALRV